MYFVDKSFKKNVGENRSFIGEIFDFEVKAHWDLGEDLGILDWERGAKVTGSRFLFYKGLGARLEWALINYMIEIHLKNGFEQWMLPLLVKPEMMYGSGQLPKFQKQL